MIVRYSKKYIRKASLNIVTFIFILDLSIVGVVTIIYFEQALGAWYLVLVGLFLIAFNYGVYKSNKIKNKIKDKNKRMREHSLEIDDYKIVFSWPDLKYEVVLKEIEKLTVKKSKVGIENIRLLIKTGREIDLEGYESMKEILNSLTEIVGDQKVKSVKWYCPSDL